MNTDRLVLETQHVGREIDKGDDHEPVSYLMSDPQRERIADTIFAGTDWPSLRGRIHGFCRREYGRCVSKVYIDRAGGAVQTGWVFERKEREEDNAESYMHEVWVTLLQPVRCDQGQEHLEPFAFEQARSSAIRARP